MKGKSCHYKMGGDTKSKLHAEVHRHRKAGGRMESPESGDDDAKKDLEDKPMRYNQGKPEDEAEERSAKRGGHMAKKRKNVGGVVGAAPRANGGRVRRARGGGCESNPFTTAEKGTRPKGRSDIEKETMGKDE